MADDIKANRVNVARTLALIEAKVVLGVLRDQEKEEHLIEMIDGALEEIAKAEAAYRKELDTLFGRTNND